jgi:hypothetical protein
MKWKTYLIMYFGTNGNMKMTDIVKKVEELGFSSALGPTDFIYSWGEEEPKKEEVLDLGNKLIETLHGSDITFNLDTHD